MILLTKFLGQSINYLCVRSVRKALHTTAVISVIGLQDVCNFSDIHPLLRASSTIVSKEGLIYRRLFVSKRGRNGLRLFLLGETAKAKNTIISVSNMVSPPV